MLTASIINLLTDVVIIEIRQSSQECFSLVTTKLNFNVLSTKAVSFL